MLKSSFATAPPPPFGLFISSSQSFPFSWVLYFMRDCLSGDVIHCECVGMSGESDLMKMKGVKHNLSILYAS